MENDLKIDKVPRSLSIVNIFMRATNNCQLSILFFLIFTFGFLSLSAQVEVLEDFVPEKGILYFKERSMYGFIHTAGFGLGYKQGHYTTDFRYRKWEFEFASLSHPKQIKQEGYGSMVKYTKRYTYGKIQSIFTFRGGYGVQHNLNEKPYWGGVRLDLSYSGGLTLAVGVPQYLKIIHPVPGGDYEVETEKYDPENPMHNDRAYIYGGAPFYTGFLCPSLYPGAYGKVGLNFEFGKYQEQIRALEVGAMVDAYAIPLQMMAFNKYPYFILNFYIAYQFGKRYN